MKKPKSKKSKSQKAWGIQRRDGTLDARSLPTKDHAKLVLLGAGLIDPDYAKKAKVVKVEVRRVEWK